MECEKQSSLIQEEHLNSAAHKVISIYVRDQPRRTSKAHTTVEKLKKKKKKVSLNIFCTLAEIMLIYKPRLHVTMIAPLLTTA